MATLPQLTEPDIRRWTGEASFARGQGYFRKGNIIDPRLQGTTLKARCLGSAPQPYYVEVALGPAGITAGHCSCPVGAGGHCKHAAALLLTWLHHPGDFRKVEELETALQRRSPAELIALIRRMVDRHPDLETLLELSTAGESGRPVDVKAIRRQVSSAFYGAGYDEWGYGIDQSLYDLVALGNDYAQRGDWRNAAAVYQTVAEGILEHYGEMHDEEGELLGVVDDCVTGLSHCLAAAEDDAQREVLLRALFDVYRWDVDFGGVGIGEEVPGILLEQATAAERQQIAHWVREALPAGDSWSDNYHRQVYGGFLLALEEDRLDDESFLRLCRETSRWNDLVDRLLTLGRLDEATAAARQVEDYPLLLLADILVAHGHGDTAETLIRERKTTSPDGRLAEWLKKRAQERGDMATAQALAEELFWKRPTLTAYQELRRLAQPRGQWEDLQKAVLARLAAAGHYHLLTEIHLEEGAIDLALDTVGKVRAPGWSWGGEPLTIRVAQAAAAGRPRDAIRLYMEAAEQLIAARGRDNYATAAGYLLQVRDLHLRLGEQARWQTLIADLRERNRTLRALKEELNKVGL